MKVCVQWYGYCEESKSGKRRAMLGKVILIFVLGSDRLHGEGDSSATFRCKGGAWYTRGGWGGEKGGRRSLQGRAQKTHTKTIRAKEYFKTLQNTVFKVLGILLPCWYLTAS